MSERLKPLDELTLTRDALEAVEALLEPNRPLETQDKTNLAVLLMILRERIDDIVKRLGH